MDQGSDLIEDNLFLLQLNANKALGCAYIHVHYIANWELSLVSGYLRVIVY